MPTVPINLGAMTDLPDPNRAGKPPHVGTSIEGAPIGTALLQVVRAHARVAAELLGEVGIVPPHEVVLLHLDAHQPVSQTELVHYLGRDRSTVSATLQAMERAGLVTRGPAPNDRRAMVVALTDKGRAAVPRVRAAWHELERRTSGALTPKQQADLITALSAVRDALNLPGGASGPAPPAGSANAADLE